MTIRDAKGEMIDKIPVKTVLISVFDKTGLEDFVEELVISSPGVKFLSTGGTYKKLKEMMSFNLVEVAEYTGFPEMEGGLVKTLHPKIHAGILGERNNPAHQEYLKKMNGEYIDMVVVNLYPFEKVISEPDTTFEKSRSHIDIGGPAMLRAAAKNFMSCAAVCDPNDYNTILRHIRKNDGCTTFEQRATLGSKVFGRTGQYDRAIAEWAAKQEIGDIKNNYNFGK